MGTNLWSHGVCLTSRGRWKPQGFKGTQSSCSCRSPCSGFCTSSTVMGWSWVWAANHFKAKSGKINISHTQRESESSFASISYLFITLMGYIHKKAKYVKQVKIKSRPSSSRTCFSSLFRVLKISINRLCNPYCAYVTLCSSVKALAVYDSWDRVNRPIVFSLLYFQMSPLSSDVITPALVQEGTSQSGVSFPPPTYPIIASPAYPLFHSGSLSPLRVTVSRHRRQFAQSSLNQSSRSELFQLIYCCGSMSI